MTPIQCSTGFALAAGGDPHRQRAHLRLGLHAGELLRCKGARPERGAQHFSEGFHGSIVSQKTHGRERLGLHCPMPAPRAPDTFPRLLLHHAAMRGNQAAIREKYLGIWQSSTWSQTRDEVEWLACGLAQEGLARGAHIAVIGANRPRLYWTLMAAQSLGAIPVPFYEDAVAQEMVYVFQNAEIEFAIVEDQEQADKLLEILPQCPKLKHIWYDNPRGLRHYTNPELANYDALREAGRTRASAEPGLFTAEIEKGDAAETAIMLYTSGTTGHPKGVVLSHANLISASQAYQELEGLRDDEEVLAYLPMAWIGQNVFSYAQWMVVGFRVNCIESAET
jgi:long-chain acyl-CoA synthetase